MIESVHICYETFMKIEYILKKILHEKIVECLKNISWKIVEYFSGERLFDEYVNSVKEILKIVRC
jgi:hypothetical protein